MPKGSPTPWSYLFVRLLFKFVLRIFYGTVVVENAELIPNTGRPCIVCANHSNSLTDALLLVDAVPSKIRNMLRLTAKSTQFGHRTLTSWLIESAGTVPIKRRKDFGDSAVDNSDAMLKLMEALEMGDAICLFPEGASRYHPTIAPLKTGVSRIISDVLTRNRDNPDFEISLLTCSITYMHRQHFRSDVLVTFNPPMTFRVKDNPELLAPVSPTQIHSLTSVLHHEISSNTIDAPSWEMVRAAKLAARIYAPLGTRMRLGDYVRVMRMFVEAFKIGEERGHERATAEGSAEGSMNGSMSGSGSASVDGSVSGSVDGSMSMSMSENGSGSENENKDENGTGNGKDEYTKGLLQLRHDLKIYQDLLTQHGLKDDRIHRPLPSFPLLALLTRLLFRLTWSLTLLTLALPGLLLWLPVFVTTRIAVHNLISKPGKPAWDTWDEIAQYKLLYGLVSGLGVWAVTGTAVLLRMAGTRGGVSVKGALIVLVLIIPGVMWITLRWLEDAISGFRAVASLVRLLHVGKEMLESMRVLRADLHGRIMVLAVRGLGLPDDPERFFVDDGVENRGNAGGSGSGIAGRGSASRKQNLGRVRSSWESGARYFSVRRRRKRDWNETLRLYDKTEYPDYDADADVSI